MLHQPKWLQEKVENGIYESPFRVEWKGEGEGGEADDQDTAACVSQGSTSDTEAVENIY